MKKLLLTNLFLFYFFISAYSQGVNEEFTANNFSWFHHSDGILFYDGNQSLAGLEVPTGNNAHSIFASLFWLAGVDDDGQLRLYNSDFRVPEGVSIQNWGPVNYPNQNNPIEVEPYNTVWFVTIDQVTEHLAYFDCLNSTNCDLETEFPNGYDIPQDFLDWPATSNNPNFDQYLASFLDYNNDGIYSAEDGDAPNFCGDFCSYSINNDIGTTNNPEDPNDIGLEMYTQVYGYYSDQDALFNTLFVKRKIMHKGDQTLFNAYLAQWTDFDLGNPLDDFVGTDVQRSMIYAYNGDLFDEPSGVGPGYGDDLPMMGIRFLGGPFQDNDDLDNASIHEEFDLYGSQSTGWGDGIVDNERLALTSSLFHNTSTGPSATTDPQTPIDYYLYMQSIWKDGTPLLFGGTGYLPEGNPPSAKYIFPGLSDPFNMGSSGEDPEYDNEAGWSETSEGHVPGDRRMLGSAGPFTFEPGDVQYLDLAYIFARESHDEDETVFETLQRYADEVTEMACDPLPQIILSDGVQESTIEFDIFPVPAQDYLQFNLGENHETIQINIMDLNGRIVQQHKLNQLASVRINIDLAPAIYVVQLVADKKVGNKKIVISE